MGPFFNWFTYSILEGSNFGGLILIHLEGKVTHWWGFLSYNVIIAFSIDLGGRVVWGQGSQQVIDGPWQRICWWNPGFPG